MFNNRGDSTKRSKFLSREYPLHIFNLTTSKVLPDKPIDCTYIKIGHLDIIIGAGSFSKNEEKNEIISKIKYLCNDKEIDYIIIPTTRFESYSFLIGSGGLFSQKVLSIKNIIYRDVDVLKEDFEKELTSTESSGTNLMPLSQILTNEIILPLSSNEILNEENNLKLNFLNTKHKYDKVPEDGNSWETYSIVTLLTVDEFSYLHLGSDVTFGYDKESGINYLLSHNKELLLDNVDVLQMPHYGAMYDVNEFISPFYNFVSKVSSAKPNNRYSYSKGSFVVLMNTTMYSITKDEQIIHKYPANLTIEKKDEDGNNIGRGLKYRKNNEEKKLLLFSTLKTDSGKSKTLPFASNSINGDLCMRVTIQHNARIENDQYSFYTKVTYGVNRNYANKVGELLFSEIYNNDGSGVNFKYENKAYGSENIMVSDEDFGY